MKDYVVFNVDRMHRIKLAYRQSEGGLWRSDCEQFLQTIEFRDRGR